MLEFWLWLLVIFLLVYEPIFGYLDFQKLKRNIGTNKNERVRFYKHTMIGLWMPTIAILLIIFFSEFSFSQIGLGIPTIQVEVFGKTITYLVIAIILLYTIILLYNIIGFHTSRKVREQLLKASKAQKDVGDFSVILPVSATEKKW